MNNNDTDQLPQNEGGKSGDEKPIYIHRAVRNEDHPYFITNRATAQDTTLTYEAAGLLWYLLSKPDTWKVIPVTLQRKGEGKKKGTARGRVYNLLNELIESRYIERIYHRDSEGKVADVEYIIHERPYPFLALQEMEDQEMEKQHNRKERKVGNKEREKKDIAPATQDAPDKPPKKRSPIQLANDALVDALGAALGIPAVGKDYSNYLKVAQALIEAGIAQAEFTRFVAVVKAEAGGKWKVTPNALTTNGRMSDYVLKCKSTTSTPNVTVASPAVHTPAPVTSLSESDAEAWAAKFARQELDRE